jgi:hypothetical protein
MLARLTFLAIVLALASCAQREAYTSIYYDGPVCADGSPDLADSCAVVGRFDTTEPEFAAARTLADAQAVTTRAPDRIMAWPTLAMHSPITRNQPGLRCRATPPWTQVIQIDPLSDSTEGNRAIWRHLANHNRALLSAGKINPALGCTAESDPF